MATTTAGGARAPLGNLANTPQHARLAHRLRKRGGLAARLQQKRRANGNANAGGAKKNNAANPNASAVPTAPAAQGGLFMMLESPLPPTTGLSVKQRAAARKHKKTRQSKKKARAAVTGDGDNATGRMPSIPFGVMHIPKNLPSSVTPVRAAACPPAPTNTPTNYFASSEPTAASSAAVLAAQQRHLKKARTHEVSPSALFVQLYARSSQKARRPPTNAPARRNMLDARRCSKLRPPASVQEVEARRQEMAGMAVTNSGDSAKGKPGRESQKRKRQACSMGSFACAGGRDNSGGRDDSFLCLLQ